MTLTEYQAPNIDTALDALTDSALTIEDRAAAYGVIHQVQLRLNRSLRKVRDELVSHLITNDLKELGPISLKSVPFDVEYPCNAEGNWTDLTVQDTFRTVIAPIAPEFVRLVPEHYEIRTAELGAAVAKGDPVARQLHRELKDRHWRTEGGRRMTLAVKEVKP